MTIKCRGGEIGGEGGGGAVFTSCVAVVSRSLALASLLCRDGARRVFSDLEDIACSQCQAP